MLWINVRVCRIRLANEVKGFKALRALNYSLLVKCPIADSKYCFSKVFTGFPNTIYQLIQGNNVKVWEAWRRHVEPADMSVWVWVNPLTFYLDTYVSCLLNVNSMYFPIAKRLQIFVFFCWTIVNWKNELCVLIHWLYYFVPMFVYIVHTMYDRSMVFTYMNKLFNLKSVPPYHSRSQWQVQGVLKIYLYITQTQCITHNTCLHRSILYSYLYARNHWHILWN